MYYKGISYPISVSAVLYVALNNSWRAFESENLHCVTLWLSVYINRAASSQFFKCRAQTEEILSKHIHKGAFIGPIMLMCDRI